MKLTQPADCSTGTLLRIKGEPLDDFNGQTIMRSDVSFCRWDDPVIDSIPTPLGGPISIPIGAVILLLDLELESFREEPTWFLRVLYQGTEYYSFYVYTAKQLAEVFEPIAQVDQCV